MSICTVTKVNFHRSALASRIPASAKGLRIKVCPSCTLHFQHSLSINCAIPNIRHFRQSGLCEQLLLLHTCLLCLPTATLPVSKRSGEKGTAYQFHPWDFKGQLTASRIRVGACKSTLHRLNGGGWLMPLIGHARLDLTTNASCTVKYHTVSSSHAICDGD